MSFDAMAFAATCIGSLVGGRFAEPFNARTPLLVESPASFLKVRFG